MHDFPLQRDLIAAVTKFANAKINRPEQVLDYFTGTWQPDSVPKLRTCRKIQQEVRGWMLDRNAGFIVALLGFSFVGKKVKVDDGIVLTGQVHYTYNIEHENHEVDHYLKWIWSVSSASLRAICGLAVASIYQEKLHKRLRLCEGDKCNNIFIDTTSRGTPRKYCKSDECRLALIRLRVKSSRAGKHKKKLKGKQK